jgi:anti-anti-sigma regulatory factor
LWKISEEPQEKTETLVRQLSSPLLQVYAGVLVLPLVGVVDASRAERIMDALLTGIVQHRAEVVIIDITGIAAAGAHTAEQLRSAARAAELLGAQVILVGMSAAVAHALVQEGSRCRASSRSATCRRASTTRSRGSASSPRRGPRGTRPGEVPGPRRGLEDAE